MVILPTPFGETVGLIKTFPGYVPGRSMVNAFDVVLETSSRHLVEKVCFQNGLILPGELTLTWPLAEEAIGFSHEAAVQAAFGLVGEMQKHTNLPGVPPLTTEAGNEMVRAALRDAGVAI